MIWRSNPIIVKCDSKSTYPQIEVRHKLTQPTHQAPHLPNQTKTLQTRYLGDLDTTGDDPHLVPGIVQGTRCIAGMKIYAHALVFNISQPGFLQHSSNRRNCSKISISENRNSLCLYCFIS